MVDLGASVVSGVSRLNGAAPPGRALVRLVRRGRAAPRSSPENRGPGECPGSRRSGVKARCLARHYSLSRLAGPRRGPGRIRPGSDRCSPRQPARSDFSNLLENVFSAALIIKRARDAMPLRDFVDALRPDHPTRTSGTAIFMTPEAYFPGWRTLLPVAGTLLFLRRFLRDSLSSRS